jgi:large repetitive protein
VATTTTSGAKTNTAQVAASNQFDPDSTPGNSAAGEDDQASVTVTPTVADLSVTKTANNPTADIGQNVIFTVTVSNAGPDAANNVALTDLLPAGLTFVSSTPSQGTYVSATGIWTVGTINSGANATLQITATVTSIGVKSNTAQVSASDQFDPDSTPGNSAAGEDDQAAATVTPPTRFSKRLFLSRTPGT